jgi:16S rRNA (cytosine1402-N4)-methyltransferase
MFHEPVLRQEAVQYLLTPQGRVYVDGTVGGGGHAEEICRRISSTARLICFDADGDALEAAGDRLRDYAPGVMFIRSNVSAIEAELHALNIHTIDGLLLDLGVSSFQLDDASKGFSFRSDEVIDMRMDRRQTLSGLTVVNEMQEEDLANLIRTYGEERNARRIARAIVQRRPVQTTGELRNAVQSVAGGQFLNKTLARVFQAIRMEVNDELRNLDRALHAAIRLLTPGGRLVVISYHSLEDRIVKDIFRENAATSIPSGNKYVPDTIVEPLLSILTKRPMIASPEETRQNPRARSAKLRAAERTGTSV